MMIDKRKVSSPLIAFSMWSTREKNFLKQNVSKASSSYRIKTEQTCNYSSRSPGSSPSQRGSSKKKFVILAKDKTSKAQKIMNAEPYTGFSILFQRRGSDLVSPSKKKSSSPKCTVQGATIQKPNKQGGRKVQLASIINTCEPAKFEAALEDDWTVPRLQFDTPLDHLSQRCKADCLYKINSMNKIAAHNLSAEICFDQR